MNPPFAHVYKAQIGIKTAFKLLSSLCYCNPSIQSVPKARTVFFPTPSRLDDAKKTGATTGLERCGEKFSLHQHRNFAQNPRFVTLPGRSAKSTLPAFSSNGVRGCVCDVECICSPERGGIGVPPDAWRRRAATTRRTMTILMSAYMDAGDFLATRHWHSQWLMLHDSVPYQVRTRKPTGKSFLNVHHLPCARLHETTIPASRPLQPLPT